jgi:DNA-directed RNA polymerase specialized sigma24 family protein
VRKEETPEHRILREIFRHYTEYKEYVAQGNFSTITHSYLCPVDGVPAQCSENPKAAKEHEAVGNECVHCGCECRKVTVSFDFWDLHRGLKELAPRKREALYYNVILDQKQKDVAKTMIITTVTVGQYVEHAFKQLVSSHVIDVDWDEGEPYE